MPGFFGYLPWWLNRDKLICGSFWFFWMFGVVLYMICNV